MKESIVENINFNFTPEFEIKESKTEGAKPWLQIGGVALTEGTSKNNNFYSFNNLKENDGKPFKWLVGHPSNPEDHVVGNGSLKLDEGKLLHEGKIRNTANHPDIVEQVRDGFLGPSIHASASKVTRKEGKYYVEGLEIDGVGLVAFQGVKNATIDYALAESFELKESSEGDEVKNNDEVSKMDEPEEKIEQPEEKPKETPEVPEETPEEETQEDGEAKEKLKAVEKELSELKESKKLELVKQLVECSDSFKEEELLKESEDMLKLRLEYEKKMETKTEEAGIVESTETEEEIVVEAKDGSVQFEQSAWESFNEEIRKRV